MSPASYPAASFLQAARQQRDELRWALAEIERRRAIHARSREELVRRRDTALIELVAMLLPDLAPATLGRAAACTGYPYLDPARVQGAMDTERQRLQARLAQIEADPRFRDRELLRAPNVGTLTRAIAELEQFRAPLADVLRRADHLRLDRLLEVGYGTPDYAVPFWRTSYYADWKAGDEIVEQFGGDKPFAEIRAEVLEAQRAIAVYDQKLFELRGERAAGEALEQEHTTSQQALAALPTRHLAALRNGLAQHLSDIDLAALGTRFAQAPELEVLAKRYWGLRQQVLYVDRLAEAQLSAPAADLSRALAKLEHDVVKWSRPKNQWKTIPAAQFERRFQSRTPRFQKSFERFDRAYGAVYGFDAYDRARLADDFLWWDFMTGGRIDGGFIPEVDAFRRRHPGYVYRRDAYDDHEAAAAAAVAHDSLSGRDDALLDVS